MTAEERENAFKHELINVWLLQQANKTHNTQVSQDPKIVVTWLM